MVQGTAILVIDFGNSSTKGTVLFGRDAQTGKYRERRFELPNVFATVDEGYVVSPDYSDATSTIISVDSHVNGMDIVGNFCNGELQERERPLATIKPSAFDRKYNLEATVLSLRMAFLYAYKSIMNIQRVSDVSQVDVEWNVVTLLPPGDIDVGREPMTELIKEITEVKSVFPDMYMKIKINNVTVLPEGFCAYAGIVYDKGEPMTELIKEITEVKSVFPDMYMKIKINNVTVLPEGFCAYAGIVYDKGQIYRRGYEYLKNETVMVYDIGAGTTDCMLIKNNKLVQDSKHTVNQGGNNVYQLVRRELRLQGIEVDAGTLEHGVIKGYIKDGAKEISIIDIINKAKSEVASKIVSDFQDYLSTVDINMRSIGYVLVCGGGSMSDESCPDILPLSKSLIELLHKLSPNMELVQLPKQTVSVEREDGSTVPEERTISARMLNLIGASILAEALK